MEAHDLEVVATDHASLHYAGFTQADHSEFGGREIAERAQGFNAGAQIQDFWHGERCVVVACARGALADVDQPVLVAIDERLEEHTAHQREDGGVSADAKSQSKDDGDCKPLRAHERVERNSQITKK